MAIEGDIEKLLSGTKISKEEWLSLKVEKLELIDGEVCGERNLDLLKLLLKNVGLMRTVDLFPHDCWLRALWRSTQ